VRAVAVAALDSLPCSIEHLASPLHLGEHSIGIGQPLNERDARSASLARRVRSPLAEAVWMNVARRCEGLIEDRSRLSLKADRGDSSISAWLLLAFATSDCPRAILWSVRSSASRTRSPVKS
jgi:hypothetical protein